MRAEQGFTLTETLVAAGICTAGILALCASVTAFAKFGAHAAGPLRTAATSVAEQTLRSAQDAWKYGSPGTAPSGDWNTSMPVELPGVGPTSAPVGIAAQLGADQSGATILTVTVTYTPDPERPDSGSLTVSGPLTVKAPLPGSRVVRPGIVAAPAGAP